MGVEYSIYVVIGNFIAFNFLVRLSSLWMCLLWLLACIDSWPLTILYFFLITDQFILVTVSFYWSVFSMNLQYYTSSGRQIVFMWLFNIPSHQCIPLVLADIQAVNKMFIVHVGHIYWISYSYEVKWIHKYIKDDIHSIEDL